jgi:hypothetical protein
VLRSSYEWLWEVERNFPEMTNISNEERERRSQAVEFARASVGLEGMIPSAACLGQARHFIEGEIDLDEFLQGSLPVVETPAR